MFTYNLMFVSFIFLSMMERYNLLYSRFVPIIYSMIFVIVFTSIRGDVGQDTSNYLLMYMDIEKYKGNLELGFYSLAKFLSTSGFSFNFFLLVTSTLSVTLYYLAVSKFIPQKYIIISFMIIFCDLYLYFNISGLRQGIALSFCLLSSYFAYNRRYICFIFLVLFATSFHKSAIVFLVVYPLLQLQLQFNLKHVIYIALGCLSSFVLTKNFLFATEKADFIKGGVMYLSEDYNTFSITSYFIGFCRRLYPIVLFFCFYNNVKDDPITKSVFNVYLFGFMLFAVNYPIFQDITVRISSYFTVFEAILVVRILINLKGRLNQGLVILMIYFVVYFKIYTYSSLPAFNYIYMEGVF